MDKVDNTAPVAVDSAAQSAADNLRQCVSSAPGGAHASYDKVEWLQQDNKVLATRATYDSAGVIYFQVGDKNFHESDGHLYEAIPPKTVLEHVVAGVLGTEAQRKLSEKDPDYKEAAAALQSFNFNAPPCLRHD